MPTINIDISKAKGFEDLPLAEYYGEIEKIVYMPPREQGKFGQLRVQYSVIDGDQLGRSSSEFLSLSPKATFRLVAWLKKFGGEWEDMDPEEVKELSWETDDDDELIDPDLNGLRVIFKVHEETDKKTKEVRVKTSLVSVEDDVSDDDDDDDEDDDDADDSDDSDDSDDEDEEEEAEPEPKPAPKKAKTKDKAKAPRRPAKAARPARRTLR